MMISSLNVNKFCGPYGNPKTNGGYYNPRNINFKTQIRAIVEKNLKSTEDIFFLQEVLNNKYIELFNLFPEEDYKIHFNQVEITKSHVVAVTLKQSKWDICSIENNESELTNKMIRMKKGDLTILGLHKTDEPIKEYVDRSFLNQDADIIIGDFNDISWIEEINNNNNNYRDLVTEDMVTYKPAQSTIDRIFVRNKKEFKNKIVFNGIVETYATDHNLLTFQLNI